MDGLGTETRWLLAYVALFLVFAVVAETEFGPVAGGLAALTATGATFALLPTSLRSLGFIQ